MTNPMHCKIFFLFFMQQKMHKAGTKPGDTFFRFSYIYVIALVVNPLPGHKILTLWHTILTLNQPNEEGFGKHCGKRGKCSLPKKILF